LFLEAYQIHERAVWDKLSLLKIKQVVHIVTTVLPKGYGR